VSRFNQSISVEELNVLTRKMNIQTRKAQTPLFRSHSAPIDASQLNPPATRIVTETHKAYRSYSEGSSSGSSISTASSNVSPPSRYHHTKRFKRRVTFNEAVTVFELPCLPDVELEPVSEKRILPYTKTRMKIKKDTIKFEEIKPMKRPSTRRFQSRMTSYVRDKLKAN